MVSVSSYPNPQMQQKKVEVSFTLLKKVYEALHSHSIPAGKIGCVCVPVDISLNLLEELSLIHGVGRYYWASRDEPFEMAGWGETDIIVAEEQISNFSYSDVIKKILERLSPDYPDVHYYGGFKFLPLDNRGKRWKDFRAYRFIAPRIELLNINGNTQLVCNIKSGNTEQEKLQIDSILDHLYLWLCPVIQPQNLQVPLVFHHRVDCPQKQEWIDLIQRSLSQINEGYFNKVVLARETTFDANQQIDPVLLIKRLSEQNNHCYRFCFNPVPERGFVGLSPERLYKRENTYLETEALAGTISRGKNEIEDEELKTSLLNNKKERLEHEIVVNTLKTNLENLCSNYEHDQNPKILTLPAVHHLLTKFKGTLHPDVKDEHILEQLHPTPAIGGYPRKPALEWIQKEEPLDRGIYSGPVGWIAYNSAEFCVGIRSALVQGNKISLYSGAGIVQGSQPEAEWNELECKIQSYLNILLNLNHKDVGEKI